MFFFHDTCTQQFVGDDICNFNDGISGKNGDFAALIIPFSIASLRDIYEIFANIKS